MAVDVARVRQYNARLATNKEKTAQLRAEVNMTNNEIAQLCAELSKELGKEITPENAMAEYEQYIAQLESTLTAGEQILDRVENTGNQVAETVDSGNVFNQPQVEQVAQPQVEQPAQPAQPAQPQVGQPAQQQIPQGGYNGFANFGAPQGGGVPQFGFPQFQVGNQQQAQPQAQPIGNAFGGQTLGI